MAYQFTEGPIETAAAELAGFLDGISYLNQNRRSNFAESFLLNSVSDNDIASEINAKFQDNPVPSFVVRAECEINFRELEQDLRSNILCDSFITDSGGEADLRAYISFKVMDRIDDVFEPDSVRWIKKLTGSFGGKGDSATFYLLTSSSHTLVIYLHTRAEEV